MRIVAGNFGAGLVTIGMAVSICATFVGSTLSGARIPFAAHPGAEMRVVPGMDHSLTITSGRVPAESMMIEFVLTGQKDEPAPVRTTQRAAASSRARSKASPRAAMRPRLSALRRYREQS